MRYADALGRPGRAHAMRYADALGRPGRAHAMRYADALDRPGRAHAMRYADALDRPGRAHAMRPYFAREGVAIKFNGPGGEECTRQGVLNRPLGLRGTSVETEPTFNRRARPV